MKTRQVTLLAIALFFQYSSSTIIAPMLPIYLKTSHTSYSEIGLIIGSFFIANLIAQYPAGLLADTFGARPAILLGLLAFSLSSAVMTVLHSVNFILCFRIIQGLGTGAFLVGVNSSISHDVNHPMQGRAFSLTSAGVVGGQSAGAFFSGLIGYNHIKLAFLVSALLACFTALSTAFSKTSTPSLNRPRSFHSKKCKFRLNKAVVGTFIFAITVGAVSGIYEPLWSLLVLRKGGSSLDIGISWLSFGLPYLILSYPISKLLTRNNQKYFVLAGMIVSGFFITIYPFLPSVFLLISLGAFEATGVICAMPAALAILSYFSPKGMQGRYQGVFYSFQLGITGLMSMFAGVIYQIHYSLPFIATGVFCIFATFAVVLC